MRILGYKGNHQKYVLWRIFYDKLGNRHFQFYAEFFEGKKKFWKRVPFPCYVHFQFKWCYLYIELKSGYSWGLIKPFFQYGHEKKNIISYFDNCVNHVKSWRKEVNNNTNVSSLVTWKIVFSTYSLFGSIITELADHGQTMEHAFTNDILMIYEAKSCAKPH